MPVNFRLPPGRIVSGSPTFLQTKDYYGKPKEKPNIFFAVAVPKAYCNEAMGLMFQEALGFYHADPRIAPEISKGLAGKFAWKIDDGDAPDNVKKEGYAGCYVFKFSTTLGVPSCFDRENRPMDPATIKRGYFVEVFVTAAPNELHDQNAGLFLNPNMVRFVAFGPEIMSGPTPEEAFGAAPAAVPAGGSLTPFAAGANPFAAVQTGQLGPQTQAPQHQHHAQGFPAAGQPQAQPQYQRQTQPVGFQPQAGMPGAATGPTAQAQLYQAPVASAGHGSQMGTAYPGNPQTFPGT